MKLAFFGAFNPPTKAHLELGEYAMKETGAEQVIYVPSQMTYIRDEQGKDFAYSNAQRLAMLRKAAARRPWMAVTDWEMRQERQPRTYETLCHLREEGQPVRLLLGSDKLPELEHGWRHPEKIVKEFGIVCLTRGGDDCEGMIRRDPYLRAMADGIQVLKTPERTSGISSTEVRRRVREIRRLEKELGEMVPPEIREMLETDGGEKGESFE